MCRAVVSAVRAVLEEAPYRTRFTFEVYGWESEQGKLAQQVYCFGADRHGWVVPGPDGKPLACRPSHFYGDAEIRADLDRILAADVAKSPSPSPVDRSKPR